jgi:hypothetical protein
MDERMSAEEYRKTGGKIKKPGRIKENRKYEIDGYKFNLVESTFYNECRLDPNIEIIDVFPKITLMLPFVFGQRKIQGMTYKPEMIISDNDELFICEVKSVHTKKEYAWTIRRKLLLLMLKSLRTPHYNFMEIVYRIVRQGNTYIAEEVKRDIYLK